MKGRVVALVAGAVLLAGCSSTGSPVPGVPGVGGASCGSAAMPAGAAAADPEQITNAKAIAAVAVGLGLGQPGVRVGVLTADVEADLHNVNVGDMTGPGGTMSTSRGLFQQLDAWGLLADRMDPTKAATMFYTGGAAGQPGLMQIPGWQNMDVGTAMQAVQGSEFGGGTSPGYAQKLAFSMALADAIGPTCKAQINTGNATPGQGGGANQLANSPTGLGGQMNQSQDPTTFGWQANGPQEPLVWQGHDFGKVAQGTVGLWTAFLNTIVPTIPGGLNSNIGCYENRNNVNSPGQLSFHAFGLACDLNTDANPNGSDPAGLSGQYVVPMSAQQVATKFGMLWGGMFTGTKDPMHFEIHLTPQQVAAATTGQAT